MTVLARGKRYEEVRDEGIVIEDPFKNKRSVTKVPAIDRLDPNDLYDYVLVVVRLTSSGSSRALFWSPPCVNSFPLNSPKSAPVGIVPRRPTKCASLPWNSRHWWIRQAFLSLRSGK